MESDLSKMDIIHLIRGTEIPDYKTMFEIKNMGLGDYIGGFVDSFEWNNTNSESWDKYSEEELLKLYKELTKNKVMKANEALKSKFVYPDKLYARCKDNKILDMSYAPQNMEAVEYIRTDAFIEKAIKYIANHFLAPGMDNEIKDFESYIKGE